MRLKNRRLVTKLEGDGSMGEYSDFTEMPDGSLACVAKFLFTCAILHGVESFGYNDRWCYHDKGEARDALEEWKERYAAQVEPAGWHRHPNTGRRVREDGSMYIHV